MLRTINGILVDDELSNQELCEILADLGEETPERWNIG